MRCRLRSTACEHGQHLCGAGQVPSGHQDVPDGTGPDSGGPQGGAAQDHEEHRTGVCEDGAVC